jgi:hypothetical protein
MKKILALVCFLVVAAACSTEPTTNTGTASNANNAATMKSTAPSEPEMTAKEKAVWETLKQKDLAAFGNMLTSDYIEVTDEGVYDKTGIVAYLKDLNLTEVTFSDWKMLPIDNDAVILTYQTNLKGTFKSEPISPGPYRSAAVWVKREGKWQDFYFQETLVKPMPPPPTGASKPERAAASPVAKPAEAGPDPMANEKIVWDTFKTRNYAAFAALLAPEFVEINGNAVYDKAGAVKSAAEFDASQIDLSAWKSVKINNDAALVTYLTKAKDPKMDPERHTTIWANRGGKWIALLHMGTPVAKPAAKPEAKKT